MYCPKCGTRNEDGARFCVGCGRPLPQRPGTLPTQSQMPQQDFARMAGSGQKQKPLILAGLAALAILVVVVLLARGCAFSGSASSGSQTAGEVAVSPSVNDYSWQDLKRVSEKIADAPSDSEGLKIAAQYHLCTSDGRLDGTQAKDVTLTDGTKTSVIVAGFRHDDKADGTGKAGITFMFKDAIALGSMNARDTNTGGWKGSSMRSWLVASGMELMPDDLKGAIVSVKKYTNNAGQTASSSAVTATDDALWLFSYNELGGSSQGWADASVYQSEGSIYQLLADASNPQALLEKTFRGQTCRWWERNPDAGIYHSFMAVNTGGNPYDRCYSKAASSYAIVPGFCI